MVKWYVTKRKWKILFSMLTIIRYLWFLTNIVQSLLTNAVRPPAQWMRIQSKKIREMFEITSIPLPWKMREFPCRLRVQRIRINLDQNLRFPCSANACIRCKHPHIFVIFETRRFLLWLSPVLTVFGACRWEIMSKIIFLLSISSS